MTNAIALLQEKEIDYSKQAVIDVLKATVAQNTTNDEFAVFAAHCKATGLNPLKREVWCVKPYANAQMQLMTGINGYHRIANSHPQYDGMETEFRYDTKGNLHSCVVKVFRKDRSRPQVGTAIYAEVKGADVSKNDKPTVWGSRPHQMLEKCAESFALRKAFPVELAGMYTKEEMPSEFSLEKEGAIDVTPEPQVLPAEPVNEVTKDELGELTAILKQVGCSSLEDCRQWTIVALQQSDEFKLSTITRDQYIGAMELAKAELDEVNGTAEPEQQSFEMQTSQVSSVPEHYQESM